MAQSPNTRRILRWVFGIFGGFFLLAGAVLGYLSYDFYINSDPARGTVVDIEVNSSSDGTTYRPKVRFLDASGRKWVGTTFLSSSGYDFDIGERVDIRYDRRDPTSIRMDNWLELWGFATIFVVLGAVVILVVMLIGSGRGGQMAARRTPVPDPAPKPDMPKQIKPAHVMDHERKPAIKPRAMDRQPTVRRRR